jgi:hypothetical protein
MNSFLTFLSTAFGNSISSQTIPVCVRLALNKSEQSVQLENHYVLGSVLTPERSEGISCSVSDFRHILHGYGHTRADNASALQFFRAFICSPLLFRRVARSGFTRGSLLVLRRYGV